MLDQVIQKKITELPPYFQYAFEHFPLDEVIGKLTQRYHLHIDQSSYVRREILLTMVGVLDQEGLVRSLQEKLALPDETFSYFVKDMNETIFVPFRNFAFQHKNFSFEGGGSPKEEATNNFSQPQTQREIPHELVKKSFQEEGIELVDEEERKKPETELQKLADTLFQVHEGDREDSRGSDLKLKKEDFSSSEDFLKKQERDDENEEQKEKNLFREEILEEDLEGVHEHRIDTGFLDRIGAKKFYEEHPLVRERKEKISLHTGDIHDFSQDPGFQTKDDFLKKIGAE